MRVTEIELDEFRREHLNPEALLRLILRYVVTLLRLGVGVGKSAAIDALLGYAALYREFDIVLYVAPTWDVIRERRIVADPASALFPIKLIDPRPTARCGQYAAQWTKLESRNLAALAKDALCRPCQAASPDNPCKWPDQWRDLDGVRVLFVPEQHLLLNRSMLPMILARTGAKRPLVILDEGKLLDASFVVELDPQNLLDFARVLDEFAQERPVETAAWIAGIADLLAVHAHEIGNVQLRLPQSLLYETVKLERIGVRLFGDHFYFIGYDVMQFAFSRSNERKKRLDGRITFVARPYLHAHVLIGSAHLDPTYVAHRMGLDEVSSPFENVTVSHTRTRVINLRSRLGCASYFLKNKKQVLDTFAVVIRANVQKGVTTLLVCRKKHKEMCADYLRQRLLGWGLDVRFALVMRDVPASPDPSVIPVINYGVLGVNDFSGYESAYCISGYYVSSNVLNRALTDSEPGVFGYEVKIVASSDLERRAELVEPVTPSIDRRLLANLHLARLEIDPVIQAAGRVRFLTNAREVVTFAMADLKPQIGDVIEVRSFAELRSVLGVPSATEIDRQLDADRVRTQVAQGRTVAEAAATIGKSRRTAFRLLAEAEGAKKPTGENSYRVFGTPSTSGGAS